MGSETRTKKEDNDTKNRIVGEYTLSRILVSKTGSAFRCRENLAGVLEYFTVRETVFPSDHQAYAFAAIYVYGRFLIEPRD